MIKKELDFVYITSDGRRFLDKQDALMWQEGLDYEQEQK